MTRREVGLTIAVVLLSLSLLFTIAACWCLLEFKEQSWRYNYDMEVMDVANLVQHYLRGRAETGRWPKPGQVYLNHLQLRESKGSADERVDGYWRHPNGPWIEFYLRKDGTVDVLPSWTRKPPPE